MKQPECLALADLITKKISALLHTQLSTNPGITSQIFGTPLIVVQQSKDIFA
ncbi:MULTISPECIES: hypothetical protein [Nitrosomonas]|uniref:hypothetical protein n=1 Tax=Nitrosomonas TaxID=914 RepID=UPI000A88A202|nr:MULTISPECIES: hypothetical protein [Nitrosomonas]